MIDAQAFGAQLADIVKGVTGPLIGRITELEGLVAQLGARPAPQEIDIDQVRSVVDEVVSAAIKAIPAPQNGRDGLDVKDLLRAEGGRLIAVMSDGSTKDLGQFVGRDGKDGLDGRNGHDGQPGRDGEDGKSFEDFTVLIEDGRTILRFSCEGTVKDVPIPGLIYRGVWKEGSFEGGDNVTFGGHVWIARRATDGKPGESDDWQLAVKKGRDGRDGIVRTEKAPAPVQIEKGAD